MLVLSEDAVPCGRLLAVGSYKVVVVAHHCSTKVFSRGHIVYASFFTLMALIGTDSVPFARISSFRE